MLGTKQQRGCSPLVLLGCGCGLLAGIGILCVFALLTLQYAHERRDPTWSREDLAACEQNLLYLKNALSRYQQDHHQLPAHLNDLRGYYLDSPKRLHCPLEIKGKGQTYLYTPYLTHATDPLITCNNHGQGALVLLHNGKLIVPGLKH